MNYLIPLMVVIPILAALIVNIFGGKDNVVKAISIVVAIAIPLIAVIAAVIGTGEEGIIGSAFSDLIQNFLDQAGVSLGGE